MSEHIWCVDLGGTKVQSALLSADKKMIDLKTEATFLESGPEGLVNQLLSLFNAHKIRPSVGVIASAGPLNSSTGELLNPTNLKTNNRSWGRFNLINALSKKIDIPLYLENDAAAAADGEYWLRGLKDFVILTLGTGLGVAAYSGGQRVKGSGGLHPEVSHQWSHKEGKTYEQLLSAAQWQKKLKKAYNNEGLAKALKNKDEDVTRETSVYIDDLVKIMRNFYLIYMPNKIVLAGGFAEYLKPELGKINIKLQSSTKDHHYLIPCPEVIVSEDYRYNGLYGAGYIGHNILKSK